MPFIKHEPPQRSCTSPEHNPPTMIVLPPGQHTYQCPACGQITEFYVGEVTCMNNATSTNNQP